MRRLFGIFAIAVFAVPALAQTAAGSMVPAPDITTAPAPQVEMPAPVWSAEQAMQLALWLDGASREGLPDMSAAARALRDTISGGDDIRISEVASVSAARLLELHRNGAHNGQRRAFGITGDSFGPAADAVAAAISLDRVNELFVAAVPTHPNYIALRNLLATEADAARLESIRLNMDRWRWMPRNLGQRYLLVNIPSFEVTLWQDGRQIDRWRTVVGRTTTQTNGFSATVTGVILNPWWEIPTSIANEGVAARVRANPAREAARGFVFQDGRYRQRPGASNSLGRMKLVMPNGHAIFLHDTPSQSLFANPVRAYSHGCVRVNQALDFATALLSAREGWTRATTDAAVASGRTQTVDLPAPIPVYISYFTIAPFAAASGANELRSFPDVYGRDRAGAR
ncbi:MAG: L,D-transpeptidase family protein [Sphingopyxis sp.]